MNNITATNKVNKSYVKFNETKTSVQSRQLLTIDVCFLNLYFSLKVTNN